ncbi:MAG: hypothetical protein NVSMB53_15150 [Gemmatimonadaceae bacterium]
MSASNRHLNRHQFFNPLSESRRGRSPDIPRTYKWCCQASAARRIPAYHYGTPFKFAILLVAVMLRCKEITVEVLRRVDPASNNVTPRVDSDR